MSTRKLCTFPAQKLMSRNRNRLNYVENLNFYFSPRNSDINPKNITKKEIQIIKT